LLSLPNWGPLYFLEHGFADAFLQSIQLLAINHQWEAIVQVSNTIFDKVIFTKQEDPKGDSSAPPQLANDNKSINTEYSEKTGRDQYMNASREWFLWMNTLTAIRNLPDGQK
jgi:hypothetical protein